MRGIPSDQRSIKTIAKVGGLVGKTIEIDETTRNRNDFVRIKLACRDVSQVPNSAENTLGMLIYDFFSLKGKLLKNLTRMLSRLVSAMKAKMINLHTKSLKLMKSTLHNTKEITKMEESLT